jgi:hypothetical protein
MTYNTVRSIIWGFKNLDNVSNLISKVKECDKCENIDFETDGVCEKHKKSYEKLVQNGPYGQTIIEILTN